MRSDGGGGVYEKFSRARFFVAVEGRGAHARTHAQGVSASRVVINEPADSRENDSDIERRDRNELNEMNARYSTLRLIYSIDNDFAKRTCRCIYVHTRARGHIFLLWSGPLQRDGNRA